MALPISVWKALINKTLPLNEATYVSRGVPDKFNKVCGRELSK